jgi:hypothetical protein
MDEQVKIFTDQIAAEVTRAMTLHPPINSLHEARGVIEEEFDEFWDEAKLNPRKMTDERREEWKSGLRMELMQTAAMCVRAIVDLKL